MSNNDIDRAFIELKALSQKKGYLLFDDLERGTDGLSLNEVDWLTNRLLTSGVEIFDDVPDTIKNGPGFKLAKIQGNPIGTLLFLKYKTLKPESIGGSSHTSPFAAMLLRGKTYPANPSGMMRPNPSGILATSPGFNTQS